MADSPDMDIIAWRNVAVTLPKAVAIVLLNPYLIPWVRARIMLGPGIMDATKTVIQKKSQNSKDIRFTPYCF